ncbi:DUF3222 family protein [Rhodopseudomonas pseudopalustris]|uniref:DUF3222 domain-containing protein n=2 Tax=Rhodopseudomonas TaxID=1073 RepID=Q13B36_RHOPS|nr:DUF3222 family protein [Rhodopseudomonas pseudopalustris]ABE38703.1 conserved hypothetical protein [Rhodopseudomonas palustris BisB5]MBB1091932.1 DUF3222 family protein [Rhodopseudomonas palustris]SEO39080.1 Protein of unknown function [Rhodopseudomonas pseudopalustris]
MTDAAAEEIRKIAAALVKTAIEIVSEEDGGAHNQCKLCNASVPWLQTGDEIKHAPDCPVVIAQRILSSKPRLHSV